MAKEYLYSKESILKKQSIKESKILILFIKEQKSKMVYEWYFSKTILCQKQFITKLR